MNRRHAIFRICALLLATSVWLVQVGQASTHTCPAHEESHAPAGHAAASHHTDAGAAQDETPMCDCLGECCVSPPAVRLSYGAIVPAANVAVTATIKPATDTPPDFESDRRLPFPLGPPADLHSGN